jgi:hypothetical protein
MYLPGTKPFWALDNILGAITFSLLLSDSSDGRLLDRCKSRTLLTVCALMSAIGQFLMQKNFSFTTVPIKA